MPLSREEFRERTVKILADPGNVADVSKLLSELVDDHLMVAAERDAADNLAQDLKKKNDELIKQNMDLYLKTAGAPGTGEQAKNPAAPPPKPVYESLFDENGRLKKK